MTEMVHRVIMLRNKIKALLEADLGREITEIGFRLDPEDQYGEFLLSIQDDDGTPLLYSVQIRELGPEPTLEEAMQEFKKRGLTSGDDDANETGSKIVNRGCQRSH